MRLPAVSKGAFNGGKALPMAPDFDEKPAIPHLRDLIEAGDKDIVEQRGGALQRRETFQSKHQRKRCRPNRFPAHPGSGPAAARARHCGPA